MKHTCKGTDDDGKPLQPKRVTCGICNRSWCERCDPCPSALCHWCHGRGKSTAPLPKVKAPKAPQCDAEIADRKRMRLLPKGRLAWKGCRRPGTTYRFTPRGTALLYCDVHKDAKGHGGDYK